MRVIAGRWAGNEGVVERYDMVASGQDRVYPVVRLTDGREVRVVRGSLEIIEKACPICHLTPTQQKEQHADRNTVIFRECGTCHGKGGR